MVYRFALALLALALAAACSSGDSRRKAEAVPDNAMSASAGSTASPPKMEPKRPISEQDCSKPVELFQGNLRCK